MGLLISVLGAYVLIQWKMPGRAFIANVLLFTMIFNGGMIPTYLVMKAIAEKLGGWILNILTFASNRTRRDDTWVDEDEFTPHPA